MRETMDARPPSAWTLRRMRHTARYLRAFMRAIVVNPEAMWRDPERTILWGKIRRAVICCVPGLALHLKHRYRVIGGCNSCGASCNLLLKCPHWNETSRLCSIYDDRPMACRLFPITPADLRDRDLASRGTLCGYSFVVEDFAGTSMPLRTPLIALQRVSAPRQRAGTIPESRPIVRSVDAVAEGRESTETP